MGGDSSLGRERELGDDIADLICFGCPSLPALGLGIRLVARPLALLLLALLLLELLLDPQFLRVGLGALHALTLAEAADVQALQRLASLVRLPSTCNEGVNHIVFVCMTYTNQFLCVRKRNDFGKLSFRPFRLFLTIYKHQ